MKPFRLPVGAILIAVLCLFASLSVQAAMTVVADDGTHGADPTPSSNRATETTAVDTADVSVTKTLDTPGPYMEGQYLWYTLVVSNAGPSTATNVQVTDVPTNLVMSTISGPCAPFPCTIPSLAPGANQTFTLLAEFVPTIMWGDPFDNSATVSATEFDPVPANNTDNTGNGGTVVSAGSAIALTKSDGGATVAPGSTVSYVVTVRNNGTVALNTGTNPVTIVETVPANTTFNAGASDGGWICSPNNNAGSECRITLNSGTIPAGGTREFTFAVTVSNPLPAGVTQIANTATATLTGDPWPDDDIGSDTTPVDAAPDLSITKSDDGSGVAPGGTVAYTLTYSNTGNQAATGVVLTETVPANTLFNGGASTGGWSCVPGVTAGSTCTLNVGTVPGGGAGGSATFAATVANTLAAGISSISNTASISDDGTNGNDPTPGNNSGSDTTPVTGAADLSIAKSDGGATVFPGGTVSYTLTYSNTGNRGATGVVLTETVPANTTFNAGASTAGWSCIPNNNPASTCTLATGSVAATLGGSATFAVTVASPLDAAVTQIANTASISDDGTNGTDPTPDNNSGSDTTAVDRPQLTLAKTANAAPWTIGVAASYTLQLSNTGAAATTAASTITDAIPAGLTIGALPTGCTALGQSVTCTTGAGLAAGGSTSFVIPVTATLAAGTSVTNTAQVNGGGDPTCPGDARCISTAGPTTVNAAQLTIVKTASAAPWSIGAAASYTLQLSNTGTAATTAVSTITDAIPVGLTIGALPTGCTALGQSVTCTADAGLAAGGSTSFVIPVTPVSPAASPIENTVTVTGGGDPACPGNTRCSSTTSTSLISADVSLVKTLVTGGTFKAGQAIQYTLAVANDGPDTATNVQVTDAPSNLTITGVSGGGCAALPCTIASLASGASVELSVTATINAAAAFDNSATVTAAEFDPVTSNNTDASGNGSSATNLIDAVNDAGVVSNGASGGTAVLDVLVNDTLIGDPATLAIVTIAQVSTTNPNVTVNPATGAVSAAPGTAAGAHTVTYRICEQLNPTNCDTATVAVTVGAAPIDAVDDDLTASAISGLTGGTSATVFTNDTLNGSPFTSDKVTVTLTLLGGLTGATGNANGTINVPAGTPVGTFTVTYRICDILNPANCDSATARIATSATSVDMSVTKTESVATLSVGDPLTFTIVVTNNGPGVATNVVMNDPLPSNFSLTSFASTRSTCSGTTSVNCAIGTMLAGEAVTVTLTGTVTGGTAVPNTATVSATEMEAATANNSSTSAPAVVTPIPTAGVYGLMILAALLAFAGVVMRFRM